MNALKWIRAAVAAVLLVSVTLFFLGLAGGCGLLARVQIVPALLSCSLLPLALWLVVTALFGRVYCSTVCPLGVFQDVLIRLFARPWGRRWRPRPPRRLVSACAWAAFFVLLAVGGTSLAGLLDPYGTYGRFASQLFAPLADLLNNRLADWLGTDGPVVLFKREVFVRSLAGFSLAASSLFLLILVVAWKGRLVCNSLCPVGALLAVIARRSVWEIALDAEACVACGRCSAVCKASCLDGRRKTLDNARCIRCFNCLGVCPQGALSFRRTVPFRSAPAAARRDFVKNALMGTVAVGVTAHLARSSRWMPARAGTALPPPGATVDSLRMKCTACGLCVARCPRQVLVPAGASDYGLLGALMPKLSFARGFCDPSCTTCGEVCPSGAILPVAKKTIGRAVFDRAACLACTEKIPCGLCARRCPQQAIALGEEDAKDGDKTVKIKVPAVDASKCTGCGACENYCPAQAFRVRPLGRGSSADGAAD
ncbi:MAG: 4Fe-4S dicluster domain-containing protein [Kiritimatiellia bacterium]